MDFGPARSGDMADLPSPKACCNHSHISAYGQKPRSKATNDPLRDSPVRFSRRRLSDHQPRRKTHQRVCQGRRGPSSFHATIPQTAISEAGREKPSVGDCFRNTFLFTREKSAGRKSQAAKILGPKHFRCMASACTQCVAASLSITHVRCDN